MIDIRNIPFKGKPRTNGYVHALVSVALCILWLIAAIVFPASTTLCTIAVLLLFLLCAAVRDIKREWL